ncbi:MAG: polymerase [Verrucomicrobiota bacterium]|jgi:DNA polymerase-1
MPDAPKLLMVDGHAYAYRSFHAIRSLQSPSGIPTNAIFGFIKALTKMRAQVLPTHVVVVWDGGLHEERVGEHPEYKAQRPPMPDSLQEQIEALIGYLDAAGVRSLREHGVEADDWIASLARRAAVCMPVIIASADKDFLQLVGPGLGLLNPNDKAEKIWTPDDVRAKTGVGPGQVVDWLSLIGDTVDNIPGVAGVGPKTAADLLGQFGSVDALYARIGEVKSDRIRAALQAAEPAVRRNQRLVRLRDDTPEVRMEDLLLRPPDRDRLAGLYSGWGFRSLLEELGQGRLEQGSLL